MDLYEGAIYTEELECPKCGLSMDDWPYEFDGEKYPKIVNERKYYTGWNDMHDWDEIHKCTECDTKYWLEGGI
jgi:hypothetical protein